MSSQLEVVVSRLRIPYRSSSVLLDIGSLSEDRLLRGGLDLGTGPALGLGDRLSAGVSLVDGAGLGDAGSTDEGTIGELVTVKAVLEGVLEGGGLGVVISDCLVGL
jgi:hypothetical protein